MIGSCTNNICIRTQMWTAEQMGLPDLHIGQAASRRCVLTSFSLASYESCNAMGHASTQVIRVLVDSHRDLFTAEGLFDDHA